MTAEGVRRRGGRVGRFAPHRRLRVSSLATRRTPSRQTFGQSMQRRAPQPHRRGNRGTVVVNVIAATTCVVARARTEAAIRDAAAGHCGKTTLLNALARLVDDGARLITLEDTAELR